MKTVLKKNNKRNTVVLFKQVCFLCENYNKECTKPWGKIKGALHLKKLIIEVHSMLIVKPAAIALPSL